MISSRVAPFFRWSIATTRAVLLPSRGPEDPVAAFAPLLPLGAFFAGVAFLLVLPFAGAPLAAGARPLTLVGAFGALGSAAGLAASPRPWMRAQIRLIAVLVLLNFFTGTTPARLFQISTNRSAGQAAASSASSCWVAKV